MSCFDIISVSPTVSDAAHAAGDVMFNLTSVKLPARKCKLVNVFATVASGGGEDDTLNGSAGNDILVGGPGEDSLRGHGGVDLLIGDTFDAFNKATLLTQITNIANGAPPASIDVNDIGLNDDADTAGDDELIGGGNYDILFGGKGDDTKKGMSYF